MTLAVVQTAVAATARWLTVDHTDTLDHPVDLTESRRRQLVREAEYQQWLDEQSKVLRVSGRPVPRGRYPLRRIRAR